MHQRNELMTERVRNAAIMIYMVGNALTFTKLLSMELASLQGTGELGGKIIKALLLSFGWPLDRARTLRIRSLPDAISVRTLPLPGVKSRSATLARQTITRTES